MQYGAIDHGMPIVGSDQHLPSLAVTSLYVVPPALGPSVAALRASGGYTADLRGTVKKRAPSSTRGSTSVAGRTPTSPPCARAEP